MNIRFIVAALVLSTQYIRMCAMDHNEQEMVTFSGPAMEILSVCAHPNPPSSDRLTRAIKYLEDPNDLMEAQRRVTNFYSPETQQNLRALLLIQSIRDLRQKEKALVAQIEGLCKNNKNFFDAAMESLKQ